MSLAVSESRLIDRHLRLLGYDQRGPSSLVRPSTDGDKEHGVRTENNQPPARVPSPPAKGHVRPEQGSQALGVEAWITTILVSALTQSAPYDRTSGIGPTCIDKRP